MISITQLQAIQELYVRLFFCDLTLEKYRNNPEATLDERGISLAARQALPNVDSENFRAEIHGRRSLIARELSARYPETFAAYFGSKTKPDVLVNSTLFCEFLSSDSFLLPYDSFPHPYGIGLGYENISKFFFWARRQNLPTLHTPLRTEFSRYLLAQTKHAREVAFQVFKKGIFFEVSSTITLMLADQRTFQLTGTIPEQLRTAGFIDLNQIQAGEQSPKPQQQQTRRNA